MIIQRKISLIFAWAAVLLWMLLIFNLSSQPAHNSNELSKGVTEVVVETIEKVAPTAKEKINFDTFNHIIRKNAHFFAYLILGLLAIHAVKKTMKLSFKAFVIAGLLCVLFAISDEVHQLFVPGRGGQIKDVLIDSSGAFVGLGIYKFFQFKFRKKETPLT